MRSSSSALLWTLVAACGGCAQASEEPKRTVELVDNSMWVPTQTADDPWPEHRPAVIDCEEFFGWRTTLAGELDVEMLDCGYLALQQPLAYELPAGTRLQLAAYHFDLAAPAAAEAHMSLMIGTQSVWQKTVAIPGGDAFAPGAVFDEELTLASSASRGAPIYLHMHNHGQNSYVFVHLRAELSAGSDETG